METSKNIGVLSLLFTAGIAFRVFLPELSGSPFTAAFVSSVFCCLCGVTALVRPGSAVSDGALAAAFVFLGALCAASGEIISANGTVFPAAGTVFPAAGTVFPAAGTVGNFPFPAAGDPLQGIKDLIASIPFSDSRTGALLTALLTGDRSGLGPEVRRAFRESGASHLLALSGLHIGILYMIMDRIFSVFGGNPLLRRIRSVMIIVLAALFTLATGSSPSLVRACIFICLREVALLSGRHAPPLNILCLALLIQLCINPFAIRTVGFQLSYAAVAGIFLIFPWLDSLYSDSLPSCSRTQAIHSDSRSSRSRTRAIHSDSRSSCSRTRAIHSDSRSSRSRTRAIHSDSRSSCSRTRAIHSDSRSSRSRTRAIHSDSLPSCSRTRAIHSDSRSSRSSRSSCSCSSDTQALHPDDTSRPRTLPNSAGSRSRARRALPDPFRRIWTGAALSISCQITTAPLAWHYFHSFPQYFLLTNLIAIPLTSIFMAVALLTIALSALGLCPSMLISATDLIARTLLRSLEIISTM